MPHGERHREKRGRNYALAAALVALVVLFFFVSLAKMSTS